MHSIPQLLRPKDVAAALSLTEQRLAVMRLEGGGPVFTRIGRSIFYAPDDIRTWLAQNRRTSTSDTGERDAA